MSESLLFWRSKRSVFYILCDILDENWMCTCLSQEKLWSGILQGGFYWKLQNLRKKIILKRLLPPKQKKNMKNIYSSGELPSRARSFWVIWIRVSDSRLLVDHGRSKELMNRCPEWIHRFLWCTMIRVILDHWSWSRSPQRNLADSEFHRQSETLRMLPIGEFSSKKKDIMITALSYSTLCFFKTYLWNLSQRFRNLEIRRNTSTHDTFAGADPGFFLGMA